MESLLKSLITDNYNDGQYLNALSDRLQGLHEYKKSLAEDNGGCNAKACDMFHLNCRGTVLRIRRDTLTAVKDSGLEALFSGRWENCLPRNERGEVFIAIDSAIFKLILEYLSSLKLFPGDLPQLPSMDVKFNECLSYFRLRPAAKATNVLCTESCTASNDRSISDDVSLVKYYIDQMEHAIELEKDFVKKFVAKAEPNLLKKRKYDEFEHGSHASKGSYFKNLIWWKKEFVTAEHSDEVCTEDCTTSSAHVYKHTQLCCIDGKVLTTELSTLLLDHTSKLARNFSNAEWRKEHHFKTEDSEEGFYLIEHPAFLFKALLDILDSFSIKEDNEKDTVLSYPTFNGDTVKLEYFQRMLKDLFTRDSDIGRALLNGGVTMLEESGSHTDDKTVVHEDEDVASNSNDSKFTTHEDSDGISTDGCDLRAVVSASSEDSSSDDEVEYMETLQSPLRVVVQHTRNRYVRTKSSKNHKLLG